MIDQKLLRECPDKVRKSLSDRGGRYLPALDKLLETDELYRKLLAEVEHLRAKRNEISAKIGKLIKDNPAEAQKIKAQAEVDKQKMSDAEKKIKEIKPALDTMLAGIPNIADKSVPVGKSEKDNKLIREDLSHKKDFKFKPLDHHELGERLDILDFEAGANLSGSRFVVLKGDGAKLERALINFMLDIHTVKHGYKEIFTPLIVSAKTMTGTGQLPKFEEDLYKIDGENSYLIPTAEVTLTNMFQDTVLKESDLPKQFTACTACFRREAGSYGKDTKGLIRNHQFNKVELVHIVHPDKSMATLELLLKHAETILKELKIPYRVLELCTCDLGFSASKTYDLEVWMPGENKFREISSCSNCGDFQARRTKTRFKKDKSVNYVHTLNGSGLAVGRTLAAILENYQRKDGSVEIPKVLKSYFGKREISAK
ncbi:MAG TPA: serine--tRNA ligase [Elusimicrobiales bacterium]|nr:serine--tRNA ligase [Elusimicrobiales bacterium]